MLQITIKLVLNRARIYLFIRIRKKKENNKFKNFIKIDKWLINFHTKRKTHPAMCRRKTSNYYH